MPKKRVFLLTSTTLAVYRQQAKNLVRSHVFENSQAGLEAFTDYLDSDPWTPICFLVDLVHEEFRVERIPHVFGPDRRALVGNRQGRLFRNTPYRHAVFQGRETAGRRDDIVLFAAVTRPEVLQRWLDPITRRKVPLVGIYSLPILSKRLLLRIQEMPASGGSDYVLLVHCNVDGGLRQSFFYRQHLKMSRLAVASSPGGADDVAPDYIPGEVEKVHRYLGGVRLLSEAYPLVVYFLGDARTLMYLAQHATELPNTRYRFVDVAEVDVGIEISDDLRTSCTDPLCAGILIRAAPANHYASSDDIRYFRASQIRMAMYMSGLALLAVGIVWGMFQLSDILIMRQQTARLARQAEVYQDHYAYVSANSPEIPTDGSALKAAVETAIALRKSKTTPYGMLLALSGVLDRKSDLEIQEIEWSVSTDPNAFVGADMVSIGSGTRSALLPGSSSKSWSDKMTVSDKVTANVYRIALIKGRIAAFSGDYRRAIALVKDFAKALSQLDPIGDVRIVEQPLNIGSEEALVGKADAAPGEANFVLRVVLPDKLSVVEGR
uniref:Uncharacterized protein n=1 Tax=Candidatus Kentrum sp. TUN TaxID=2126343 RepID=A0A450ZUE2_9GAMM|nr:MAG: hypothetical protein BECKTUN1418F_GA0071002_10446 [Candidatus Kentron sp. TUN]VFK57367.1 MAG: hypothetical protein BECKTUN1418E_GA0071001_10456 [Candidatus Kentron sp. TUN]